MAGGRFNTDCESRYSPIEGELLGIACALHKTRYLTNGSSRLTILTDHKPLVGFLDYLDIKELENRRLINLKRKTDNYSFDIQFIEGINNLTDGISRIENWRKTKNPDTTDSFGRSIAWSEVSNNYSDIIDDNWFLMQGHAKVELLTKFCYTVDSDWEDELIECEINTRMFTSHSVANRMNELEEDLMVKETPHHNWTRELNT
jgi:hypothetical protein